MPRRRPSCHRPQVPALNPTHTHPPIHRATGCWDDTRGPSTAGSAMGADLHRPRAPQGQGWPPSALQLGLICAPSECQLLLFPLHILAGHTQPHADQDNPWSCHHASFPCKPAEYSFIPQNCRLRTLLGTRHLGLACVSPPAPWAVTSMAGGTPTSRPCPLPGVHPAPTLYHAGLTWGGQVLVGTVAVSRKVTSAHG